MIVSCWYVSVVCLFEFDSLFVVQTEAEELKGRCRSSIRNTSHCASNASGKLEIVAS